MRRRLAGFLALCLVLTGVPIAAQQGQAFQSLTVTSSPAVALSTAVTIQGVGLATYCQGTVETAALRFRLDGTAPTTSTGFPVNVGDIIVLGNAPDIAAFQIIAQSTTGTVQFVCTSRTTAVASQVLKSPGSSAYLPTAATGQVLTSAGVGAASVLSATPVVTSLGATGSLILGGTGAAASAGADQYLTKTVTGLLDTVATNVFTVTVPNAAHAAVIPIVLLSSLGAGGAVGAFECSGTAYGQIVIARTAGVATVATAVALSNAGSACVAGATTITTAYAVTAMTGGVGATQTFNITVAITRGGSTSTNHQVVAQVDVLNANASGITIS